MDVSRIDAGPRWTRTSYLRVRSAVMTSRTSSSFWPELQAMSIDLAMAAGVKGAAPVHSHDGDVGVSTSTEYKKAQVGSSTEAVSGI